VYVTVLPASVGFWEALIDALTAPLTVSSTVALEVFPTPSVIVTSTVKVPEELGVHDKVDEVELCATLLTVHAYVRVPVPPVAVAVNVTATPTSVGFALDETETVGSALTVSV
jgi:hypothetical protein